MTTLVIPDLHLDHKWAERLIQTNPADEIVFLGDYFDQFDDTADENFAATVWLKGSVKKPNRVHLMGNHDLQYLSHRWGCSGWTQDKHDIIGIGMRPKTWESLRFFHQSQGWLFTHAGLTLPLAAGFDLSALPSLEEELQRVARSKATRHPLLEAGRSRGGSQAAGGILWCDWSEFIPVPGLKQVFGHTEKGPASIGTAESGSCGVLLDCRAGNHFGIIRDGELRVCIG